MMVLANLLSLLLGPQDPLMESTGQFADSVLTRLQGHKMMDIFDGEVHEFSQ